MTYNDFSFLLEPATWAGPRYSIYKNFMGDMSQKDLDDYDEWMKNVEKYTCTMSLYEDLIE